MRPASLLGMAMLAPMLAGCAAPEPQVAVDVLATFYPVQFLTARIAGPHLAVGVLVPGDAEPHDYELKPSDAAAIQHARLVVIHGAGLEAFADRLSMVAADGGVPVQVASEGVALATRDGEGGAHGADPHLWLDPLRAQQEARNIARALARIDPANATRFAANLAALEADLGVLDHDYVQGLARCVKHKIITSHTAFAYVAERYNFTQIAVSGLAPDAAPSAAKVREVADIAQRENITVIFFETLVSPRVAQVIADQVHGRTEVLDPIEGLTQSDAAAHKDYIDLMRDNLRQLRDAMECA